MKTYGFPEKSNVELFGIPLEINMLRYVMPHECLRHHLIEGVGAWATGGVPVRCIPTLPAGGFFNKC
jgi:hypothetical protein